MNDSPRKAKMAQIQVLLSMGATIGLSGIFRRIL